MSTKNQLIEVLARKAHLTKRGSAEAVDMLLEEIKKALSKGEKVVLSGFGTFRIVTVKDKPVMIPGKNERRIIKAHRAARFTPGKTLKKMVR
jgi:nucleoid DNA-binding protein